MPLRRQPDTRRSPPFVAYRRVRLRRLTGHMRLALASVAELDARRSAVSGAALGLMWLGAIACVCLAMSLVAPQNARAQYRIVPLDAPDAYQGDGRVFGGRAYRHEGLLLRMTMGGGYMQGRTADLAGSPRVYGGALQYSLGVGGMVAPNFGLFANAFGSSVIDAQVTAGVRAPLPDGRSALHAVGLGLGFTYYFMPVNVYLSVSIGPAFSHMRADAFNIKSNEVGFGSEWSVAKEWWIGPELGFGLGGRVLVMQLPGSSDVGFNVFGVSLFTSLTFN